MRCRDEREEVKQHRYTIKTMKKRKTKQSHKGEQKSSTGDHAFALVISDKGRRS